MSDDNNMKQTNDDRAAVLRGLRQRALRSGDTLLAFCLDIRAEFVGGIREHATDRARHHARVTLLGEALDQFRKVGEANREAESSARVRAEIAEEAWRVLSEVEL